jgi:RTX calcium-binding nonapeptide repeat (4 copies)
MTWTTRLCASVAGLVALAAMLPAAPADARTFTGSPRADVLRGTGKADVLLGRAGNDRLSGRGGKDRLSGGPGKDQLSGGPGKDRLSGGPGNDRVTGGPGADVLDCAGGKDRAVADTADTVRASCETVLGLPSTDEPPPQQQQQQQQTPQQPSPADLLSGEYTGDLVTTVRYLPGQLCVGEHTAQIPSRITIRQPLQPLPSDLQTIGRDPNPINLILGQLDLLGNIAPGSINLASAARLRFTPINSRILHYWNLGINGTTITGTLVDDHAGEAAGFNLLGALTNIGLGGCNFPTQLAIAEGTTLTGTATPQTIQLTIQGNTSDTLHPFTAQITANRAG